MRAAAGAIFTLGFDADRTMIHSAACRPTSVIVSQGHPDWLPAGGTKVLLSDCSCARWQEANLGQLMLRCPMTDRNFSTGIDTDRKSPKRIPYARIAVRCPYCRLENTLGPQDAPLGQSALLGKQIAAPMPWTSAEHQPPHGSPDLASERRNPQLSWFGDRSGHHATLTVHPWLP
jgi:hypothetical protein